MLWPKDGIYRRDQDSSQNGIFFCVCVLHQIWAADLPFAKGWSAPLSGNIFYLNPTHLASIYHDRKPVQNGVMYWTHFEVGCQESSYKSTLMALREWPKQILNISIWTVCQRTVGTVGFNCINIQPSPSLMDNIRSESKTSSYKSTLVVWVSNKNNYEHQHLDCLPKDGRHPRIFLILLSLSLPVRFQEPPISLLLWLWWRTIMSSSISTVCQRTVGTFGFYCINIQPLPNLTDNIRSEGALQALSNNATHRHWLFF